MSDTVVQPAEDTDQQLTINDPLVNEKDVEEDDNIENATLDDVDTDEEAASVSGIHYLKKHTIVRKTKYTNTATKSTRFIFCFVVFDGFVFVSGSRNFVSADFRFVDSATSFDTGVVNRKLQNRQNENRRKQNFARQKQIQNHQKQQNKK